jgi:hypothetical protein
MSEYSIPCSICGKNVVTIHFSPDGIRIETFLGSQKVNSLDERDVEESIKNGKVWKIHALLSHGNRNGLAIYCPECNRVYCGEHWKTGYI